MAKRTTPVDASLTGHMPAPRTLVLRVTSASMFALHEGPPDLPPAWAWHPQTGLPNVHLDTLGRLVDIRTGIQDGNLSVAT